MRSWEGKNLNWILGVQRSGTSIIAEGVDAHEWVRTWYEPLEGISDVIGIHGGPAQSHRYDESVVTDEAIEHHRDLWSVHGSDYCVVKCVISDMRLPWIRAAFPGSRTVHVHREPLDNLCSMVKMKAHGRPAFADVEKYAEAGWTRPPHWKDIVINNTGIDRCARIWAEQVSIYLDDRDPELDLIVRYEEFLRHPLEMLERIWKHFQLPHGATDPYPFLTRVSVTPDPYKLASCGRTWFEPGHSSRINRWRKEFTEEDVRRIELIINPVQTRMEEAIACQTNPTRRTRTSSTSR